MTLEGQIRQVEAALIELDKAGRNADGWADQQRRDFDKNRIEPLRSAGKRLAAALQKTDEQCRAAERLLAQV